MTRLSHAFCPVLLAIIGLWASSSAAGPGTLQTMMPVPTHHVSKAWSDALARQGVRLKPEDAELIQNIHPLELGSWTVPLRVELLTPSGVLEVQGTLTVMSDALARTGVHLKLTSPPLTALLPWRRLVKKAKIDAKVALVGRARSPGELRQESVVRLADPTLCAMELTALERVALPGRANLVAHAQRNVPDTCRAEAIVMLSSDSDRHSEAVDWARQALEETRPGGIDPRIIDAMARFVDPPADFSLLVTDLSTDTAAQEHALKRIEAERAKLPLVCADGRVDPTCECGSDWTHCCTHHGGASHCQEPPP